MSQTNVNIPNDFNTDIKKILSVICSKIQCEFDMSPYILNSFFNHKNFITNCCFLQQQCYAEMIQSLNCFKQSYNPSIDDISQDEYDKCGYLLTSHHNTCVSYCNAHRYLHTHPSMLSYPNDKGLDHLFVTKNSANIIKEKYNSTIVELYQKYINKLYHMINQLLHYLIDVSCDQSTVKITDETVSELIGEMLQDINIFKSRVIYEYIEPNENKYYYIKSYRLNTSNI